MELWSASLREAKQRMRPLFAASSIAASANAFWTADEPDRPLGPVATLAEGDAR
ncbi:hypothetical protein QA634_28020 [Methylobacterium sp. CB376]|uniref:hypothetical protein n=1 Tax=unclassified Methylobacterium TaxID=2615210 RepID=UPI00223F834C|nr:MULTISPECIES: hypothetical protein [Methylobacterium]WFT83751.1 hypothetical protein QA634_28020 [Methylobacterium nodulans]